MHKTLHPRSDIDWLHLSRKVGGRGFFLSVEETVVTSSLEFRSNASEGEIAARRMVHKQKGGKDC